MTDVSEDALEVTRLNGDQLGLTDRVKVLAGHLFNPLSEVASTGFHMILSNPPYVAEKVKADLDADVLNYEPHEALFAGADGLDFIKELIRDANGFLCDGGFMLLEVGYDQKDAVDQLVDGSPLNLYGWQKDLSGHYRVVILQKIC